MSNQIIKHWIVKRNYFLGRSSFRHLVLLEDGKYYFSNGEVGDYSNISKEEALSMINRKLKL